MRGGYIDAAVCEGGGTFLCPGFEFFTVRVVFDVADHEIEQMAVLVGNDIDETI